VTNVLLLLLLLLLFLLMLMLLVVMMMVMMLVLMVAMKVAYCRKAYEELRLLFNELCGNLVDGGNALWLGLALFVVSSIFLFFLALQLMNAARTDETGDRPPRVAVIDLDLPPPKKPSVETVESQPSWKRVPTTSYRIPGKTFGDWLQGPEERSRRRMIVS